MTGAGGGGARGVPQGKRSARAWAVLEVLGRCAEAGAGWRWGGVEGWMLFDEVDAAVAEQVPEILPYLVQLDLAARVDVRPPGRSRPVWLYRVTAAGLGLLARREGRALPALADAGEDPADTGAFFLLRRIWPAFAVLQVRSRAGERSGWMTLRQLAEVRARLDSEDAAWLVRTGLAERSRLTHAAGRGSWRFRATTLGLAVEITAPRSSQWVRVRVRRQTVLADAVRELDECAGE